MRWYHHDMVRSLTNSEFSRWWLIFLLLGFGDELRGCKSKIVLVLLAHAVGVDGARVPPHPHPSITSHFTYHCSFTGRGTVLCVCVWAYVCACVHVYVCGVCGVCVHVCTCMCVVCVVCVCTCMCVCACVCVHVCVCVCVPVLPGLPTSSLTL